jgi:hypothetical protein
VTDTVVPSAPLNTSLRASSCRANALMMLIQAGFRWAKTPTRAPIPFGLLRAGGWGCFDRSARLNRAMVRPSAPTCGRTGGSGAVGDGPSAIAPWGAMLRILAHRGGVAMTPSKFRKPCS